MGTMNSIRAILERQITEDVNWFLIEGVWDDGGSWVDARVWVDGSQPNPLTGTPQVARDNVRFEPVQDQTYILSHFMSALRRAVTAGPDPEQRHSGTLMLMVHTPLYVGSGEALNLADELLDRFRSHSALRGVDVNVSIRYSEAKDGAAVPPFYVVPVEVGWYVYR